jgi:hypothetical protein
VLIHLFQDQDFQLLRQLVEVVVNQTMAQLQLVVMVVQVAVVLAQELVLA